MIFKNVDIFDLNYEHSSEEFGLLNTPSENLPKKGLIVRILILFKSVVFILFKYKKRKNTIPNGSVLFFGLHKNEKKAYSNIINLSEKYYTIGNDNFINGFPILKIYLLSLFYIPLVFYHFLVTKDRIKKLSFKYAFDSYCFSFAALIVLPEYFKNLKPKKIFVSNHTRPFQRIIMKIFSKKGLGYIQHAQFINKMPPFEGFDYFLLDGLDSLDKFINAKSSNNNIYLVGKSAFDHLLNYNKNNFNLKKIGICVNNLDDFEQVKLLAKRLKKSFPLYDIFLRPHPSDPRFLEIKDFSSNLGLIFSNSKVIDSFCFLKNIDVLLAGDSNIHIESICLNIPSIYLNFINNKNDWYGYLNHGMLYNGNSINKIVDFLNNINLNMLDVRKLGKPYIESIGTVYQGNSSSLVSEILNDNYNFINSNFSIINDLNNNNIYKLNE